MNDAFAEALLDSENPSERQITEVLEHIGDYGAYSAREAALAAAVERYREALDMLTIATVDGGLLSSPKSSVVLERKAPWLRDLKEEMDND